LAIHWKAASTLNPSFAEVSKYGMFPLEAHHALAFFSETCNQKKTENHMHAQYSKNSSKCIAKHQERTMLFQIAKFLKCKSQMTRKKHVNEKKTHHPAIPTINIYLVPQHNKWEVFRVRRAGLNIKHKP